MKAIFCPTNFHESNITQTTSEVEDIIVKAHSMINCKSGKFGRMLFHTNTPAFLLFNERCFILFPATLKGANDIHATRNLNLTSARTQKTKIES